MNHLHVKEVYVAYLNQLFQGSHIDDDLLLLDDISEFPLPEEPRRMRCLFLALCTEGEIRYTIDTVQHTVHKDNILIVGEGQVANDYQLSPDCKGVGIMLSYAFFNEIVAGVHELSSLFLFSRSHPVCELRPEESNAILNYFNAIKQKVDDYQHHFRRETVRMMISTMIFDISNALYRIQQMNDKRQTRREQIFTKFIKLVEANFRRERRVSWYAEQIGITPKHLSETVKQVSYHTPNDWINKYVTLEIRVLLKNSSKSVKQIAEELNFPNQSFFGKYFKEHVGTSPSKFRK